VEDLSDKLVGVDAQLNTMTTEFRALNATVQQAQNDVKGVTSDVAAVKATTAEIAQTTDGFRSQIASLEEQVAAQQKALKALQDKLEKLNPKCLETKLAFSTASADSNDICGGGVAPSDDKGSSNKTAVYAGVGAAIGIVLLGAAVIIYRRNKNRTVALDQAMLLDHQIN